MAEGNPLIMPKLGLTMTEGQLSHWCVGPGDRVSAGQTLFVVETDKIANDVEALADGEIINIVALEGDTVQVGGIVGYWTGPPPDVLPISSTDSAIDANQDFRPGLDDFDGSAASGPVADQVRTRKVASPLARRIATYNGVDLSELTGTGDRGRIKSRDVLADIAKRGAAQKRPTPAGDLTPASSIRRTIASQLVRSKTQIPHFYVAAQADIRALNTYRAQLNCDRGFPKLTITPFIVAAIGRALATRSALNMLWRDDGLLALPDVAVGVAVDTNSGVRMPVIAGAAIRSLDAIAAAITDAAARARAGQLRQDDMRPAAISVSNVGMMGVTSLTPIIDPNQSHILGVGAPQSLFRPDAAGAPVVVREVTLTLACDHRLVDGAAGAEFLRAIVDVLEAPMQLRCEKTEA